MGEWSAGLGQFFRTVRTFNAHRAEVSKQLELLELFGHLDPNWRAPLERAVAILRGCGETAAVIGEVRVGDNEVVIVE